MHPVAIIAIIIFFLSGLGLLATVMMHSGEGDGLSDSAAASIFGREGGTAVGSKNLDRLTVIMAVLFILSCLALMIFFPQGTIVSSGA